MNVLKTDILDLLITPLKVISDERGAVLHMLRCDELNFTQFGECYFSEIMPSSIKAWKKHTVQQEVYFYRSGFLDWVHNLRLRFRPHYQQQLLQNLT